MDQQAIPASAGGSNCRIPRWEFIALAAALMALNALAIDIMLPGAAADRRQPRRRERKPSAVCRLPPISLGFGLAQLFYGPLSDRFGRRTPLLFGLAVYVACCTAVPLSRRASTTLLALRFVQGVGAAATRVITVSIVRDVFGGRAMAEVMSLVFMVFMIIPVMAPGIGQIVMLFSEWHMIFVVMALIALCCSPSGPHLRLPETLHPE